MARSSLLEAPRKSSLEKGCPTDCPLVLVCRKCAGHEEVVDFLRKKTRATVKTVRCQKVCASPVAGIKVDGRLEWFEKMDSTKRLKALACLTKPKPPAKIPKVLKKRRSKDRSGCCR